ncbi:MAG: hypothetical protein EAY75_17780 [Bacteroidetes bacterium]|nr:MAG: hypothetical protein EAY75_17780 [Bacteroidota bacterium]
MNLKSLLARPFAAYIQKQIKKGMETAVADQDKLLAQLLQAAGKTEFGKAHQFASIKNHADYARAVPLRDYEAFKPWVEKIKAGKHNVLWRGKPLYFAKTSGTTSGVKYIPITKDSIPNHINTARNALLCYMAETGNYGFAGGKMIFLSGSPELERVSDIPTGRLSGIVNHHVPKYLRTNQLPSYETNCIDDWETKLDAIVAETKGENMTLISGIPPWMQMYFDRLKATTGKSITDLFPQLSVLVQGGVNFEPYKAKLFETIGKNIDTIELFPASEGFFAFQDSQSANGLLLNTNSGIFFEFVPVATLDEAQPTRLSLKDVKLNEQYALIISSNAGLWAYNIGDTIKFVSLNPYRIVVTGRTKHFISAFGEHVIAEEVEHALMAAAGVHGCSIAEFTVAPYVSTDAGQSYHEWFIEFDEEPDSLTDFAALVDDNLRKKNVYYDDLIAGKILAPLKIRSLQASAFIQYMKQQGKLGGQNKVPRLSNDRKMADVLLQFVS